MLKYNLKQMNFKKNSKKLTQRQKEILDYLVKSLNKNGFLPSIREIGKNLGLSSFSTVCSHLKKIEKMGFIKRHASKLKAIEISSPDFKDVCFVPIIKEESLLEDNYTAKQKYFEYFPLSIEFTGKKAFVSDNDFFIYQIKDNSLKKYSILAEDYLIMHKKEKPSSTENPDIFMLKKDKKIFFKASKDLKDIENYALIGKITGILRKLNV